MQSKDSQFTRYLIILAILLLCSIIIIFEIINKRLALNDFRVYYEATKAMPTNTQVYDIPFGLDSGYYKYSPFILLLFTPLTLLPFSISGIIYSVLIIFALIICFLIIRSIAVGNISDTQIKHENIALLIGLLAISNHIYRELHLGNVNFILLLLVILSLKLILIKKDFWGGFLFALALLIKPYLLLLAIVPVLHKKWKMFSGIFTLMGLQAILMIIVWGSSKTLTFHEEWIRSMFAHIEGKNSNNIAYYLQTLFRLEPSASSSFLIIVASAVLLSTFIVYNSIVPAAKNMNATQLKKNYSIEWLIVFAALPSIVNTDTEHFMSALPLIIIVLYYLKPNRNYILTIFLVSALILYGTNSNDVVGDTIGNFYDHIGAIGIGNILIILISMLIFGRSNRNKLLMRVDEEK